MFKKPGLCHVFVPVRQGLANSVIAPRLIPAFLFSHFQWRVNYFFVCLWHKLVYGVCVCICVCCARCKRQIMALQRFKHERLQVSTHVNSNTIRQSKVKEKLDYDERLCKITITVLH